LGAELPKLHVIAPPQYFTWLHEYAQVEEIGFESLIFIDAADLLPKAPVKSSIAAYLLTF
jgi:hypothetical protein